MLILIFWRIFFIIKILLLFSKKFISSFIFRLFNGTDYQDLRSYPTLAVTRNRSKDVCHACSTFSAKYVFNSASNLPHFCGNLQFLFSPEISVLGFPTSGKKILKKKFFFVKNFFSVKKKQLFPVTIFPKQNGG